MTRKTCALSRRNVLKTLGVAGIGTVSVGSLADAAVGRAQASVSSTCPDQATNCTGVYNKDQIDYGHMDVRATQSLSIVYFGPDGVGDQHDESTDSYLHNFIIMGHGSMRARHSETGKWSRDNDWELHKTGFHINGVDPVNPAGAYPERAAGTPPSHEDKSGIVVDTGYALASLIVGYYYPWVGIGMTAVDIAAALAGVEGDDGDPDGPTTMEQSWVDGQLPGGIGPDLSHYAHFRLEVPDEPGRASGVTIKSYSEPAGGGHVSTSYDYSVQNPGNPHLE